MSFFKFKYFKDKIKTRVRWLVFPKSVGYYVGVLEAMLDLDSVAASAPADAAAALRPWSEVR